MNTAVVIVELFESNFKKCDLHTGTGRFYRSLYVNHTLDGHICSNCLLQLESKYRTNPHATKPKRPRLSIPSRPSTKLRRNTRKKVQVNRLALSVSSAVAKSYYATAFRQILTAGPSAHRAFNSVVRQLVRRQTRTFVVDGAGDFPVFDGTESVASFAWPSLLSKLGDRLPTLFAAVCGAMPAKFTDDNGQLS